MAEKKGSDQLFAVKTIVKRKTVKSGLVKQVFSEKRVLALASGYPFLTALHSAFQTAVIVLAQTTNTASTRHWRNLKTALLFLKFPFTLG